LILALFIAWIADLWRRLWSDVFTLRGRLRWEGVPRRGVWLSASVRLLLPVGILSWLLPAPAAAICLVLLFVAGVAAGNYVLISKLTGGADSVQGVRLAWAELEWLARKPRQGPPEIDPIPEQMAGVLARLRDFRTSDTAPIVDGLTEQAPFWFATDWEWSVPPVSREIRLYKAACDLWPNDPPKRPDSSLDPDFLWRLIRDYELYVGLWRSEYTAAEKAARRLQLEKLKTYRRPETDEFLAAAERLGRADLGDEGLDESQADELRIQGQSAMDRLFPSLWVFRGAGGSEV
jgi:hypothetical protein